MKKLTILFVILSLILLQSACAYAQNVIWAKNWRALNSAGYYETVNGVLDKQGNSYTAGHFFQTAVFDSVSMSSSSGYSLFVTKYGPKGELQRIFRTTGGQAQCIEMIIDNNENLYVLGNFEGTVTIGTFTIHGDVGIESYFIAKMTPSGSVSWVKVLNNSYTSVSNDIRALALTSDNLGSIYIYGYVDYSYILDGIPLHYSNGPVYLAKLSGVTGTAIWAKQIKTPGVDVGGIYPTRIRCDRSNNVIVTGGFDNPTIVFNSSDTLYRGSTSFYRAGYMAMYDLVGNYMWSKKLDSFFSVAGIAVDTNNNSYIVGVSRFSPYTSQYSKYAPSGTNLWRKTLNFRSFSIASSRGVNFLSAMFTDSFSYDGITSFTNSGQLLFSTDDAGTLKWHSKPFDPYTTSVYSNDKGAVQISGNCNSTGRIGDYLMPYIGGFVALFADTSFLPNANNKIQGNVFNDTDNNCVNLSDPGLIGRSVVALPGPYYAVTDSFGNYSITVDTGSYSVSAISSKTHAFLDTTSCAPVSYTVSMPGSNLVDTGVDFSRRYKACSFLRVDSLSAIRTSWCDTTQIRMFKVCNDGIDTAKQVRLVIKYPTIIFSPLACSIDSFTYDIASRELTIDIGNIEPVKCTTIIIVDTITCASPPYYTEYSFEMRLTPLNECTPDDTLFNFDTTVTYFLPEWMGVAILVQDHGNVWVGPNPTNEECFIHGLVGVRRIEVRNLLGVLVFSKDGDLADVEKVDLKCVPPGVYIVSATGETSVTSLKILKL